MPAPVRGRAVIKQQKDNKQKVMEGNSSHEEGEFSQKNKELLKNGDNTGAKADKTAKQDRDSDDSRKSRLQNCLIFHLLLFMKTSYQ